MSTEPPAPGNPGGAGAAGWPPPPARDADDAAGPHPAAPDTAATDAAEPEPPSLVVQLRFAALVVVVLALLGLAIGTWWAHAAPRLTLTVFQVGKATQTDEVSEAIVGADGWFALIGAGLGILTGALAWLHRPARGPLLMVALAVGSLGGAVVAWRFGVFLGRHPTHSETGPIFARVGATLRIPLHLRSTGTLLFQPFGAVLAATIGTTLSSRPDLLHRRPKPATQEGNPADV